MGYFMTRESKVMGKFSPALRKPTRNEGTWRRVSIRVVAPLICIVPLDAGE
jgi:hypothetical protein